MVYRVQYCQQKQFQIYTVKLAKTVCPDFFWWRILIIQTQNIHDCRWKLMRSECQTIHSTIAAYPQHIIITSIVYWQALLMHHLQITVSQRQYSSNKKMSAIYFAASWAWPQTISTGIRNLTRVSLNCLLKWVTISISWFSLIISSPVNLLVQSCSHSYKNCGINIPSSGVNLISRAISISY